MARRGKRSKISDDGPPQEDPPSNNANNDVNNGAHRVLPEHVRNRQRAVAEREAARLARPERRTTSTLGHADRKKSAVTSTPFGTLQSSRRHNDEDKHDNRNAMTGSEKTTWCGPFTVARQMIAARDQAKREREAEMEKDGNQKNDAQHPLDAAMAQLEEEKRQKAHPSLLWKSRASQPAVAFLDDGTGFSQQKHSSSTAKRVKLPPPVMEDARRKVPSLYNLVVDFVVENFEHVESVGAVDHEIRTSIANKLASENRLDATALAALVEPDMEALEIIDCADVPQEALQDALYKAPALRYLILDQAGRCFSPKTVQVLLHPTKHSSTAKSVQQPVPLFALNIGGAYLLQDTDAATVIAAMAPTLQSLAWKACPLLGLQMCRSIPHNFSQNNILLEFSLEDMNLTKESWDALLGSCDNNNNNNSTSKQPWQRNLKSLSLRHVGGLQDDIVIALLQGAPDLEHVDLSDNFDLTDACLGPLRYHEVSSLRSLSLYNLKNITNIGLETLFTHGLEGMGPAPTLKRLNLNHLNVEAVTDSVMELILQCACRKPNASDVTVKATTAENMMVAHSGLSLLGGMIRVELEGAAVTDSTLEYLAATSANTLEHLNVSFCPHISDKGLGYLVDSVGNQLEGVQIWGCAQITEEFWNGHSRVVEGGRTSTSLESVVVPLQITGAWMKKSGIASIRS